MNRHPSRLAEALIGVALGGALLIGLAWSGGAAPAVIDRAGLLTGFERDRIAGYHGRLLDDHDIDYRVLTIRGASEIDRLGHEQFAELEVGGASRSGRGLLLVIDPASDRVRLEVSAALEGVFTDAFVGYLEQRQMVPFFRGGCVADGVLATTELIFARAVEASAGHAFDPATAASFSAGGGASTAARIGAGVDRTWAQDRAGVAPQATPEATVAAYLAAMADRNGRPDLAVYSEQSRRMLASWTMTPAQMDNVARTYRGCRGGEVRFGDRGDLAVLRYGPAERRCAPWLLRRENGRWTLDLATAGQAIRFNHRNEWRMPDPDGHSYAFGFADWRFDREGFPIGPR